MAVMMSSPETVPLPAAGRSWGREGGRGLGGVAQELGTNWLVQGMEGKHGYNEGRIEIACGMLLGGEGHLINPLKRWGIQLLLITE